MNADLRHDVVHIAWQVALELRQPFYVKDLAEGRQIAEHVLASFLSCPIPEIARLGRTLRTWREPFLPTSAPPAPTTVAPRLATA